MLLIQVTKIFQKKKNSVTYSFRQSFSLYGMQVLLFENQCKYPQRPFCPFLNYVLPCSYSLVALSHVGAGVSSENQAFHCTAKHETGVKGRKILSQLIENKLILKVLCITMYFLTKRLKYLSYAIAKCENIDQYVPLKRARLSAVMIRRVCKYFSPAAAFQITPMECVSLQLFRAQTSRFSLTSTPPTRKTARSSQMTCGSPSQRCRRWRSTE